jgi:hypothetical protein
MSITFVNKTIGPINIVMIQLVFAGSPIDWDLHMNIAPGASVRLRIGRVKFKQFRVYVWCGGPGTEISENKMALIMGARWGVSAAISQATAGLHEPLSGVIESAAAEAFENGLINHLAEQVITSSGFEKAIEKGIDWSLDNVVNSVIRPKEFGVCSEFFWSAMDDNIRCVYGGPSIQNGKIVQNGSKLNIREDDNGYDPVKALKALKRASKGETNGTSGAAKGAAVVVGGALFFGASFPLSALAGGAYYLWKKQK